jgi:hypothetical protein
MKFIASIILVSFCLVLTLLAQQEKGWHGIVPLHSSRTDVEKLLGPSADSCRCLYKTEHEIIHIQYSDYSCEDDSRGWDVPLDTVLLINVSPKTEVRLADLKLDLTKYQKTDNKFSPGMSFYTHEDGSIFIIVTGTDELVGSINYQPTKNDEKSCRCQQRH